MNQKYVIKEEKNRNIAFVVIPFKRNQDVIKILKGNLQYPYIVSVVDGWNDPKIHASDLHGRRVASLVADIFPKKFLESNETNITKRAQIVASSVDDTVNNLSPHYASAVAAFLFTGKLKDVIVSVGDVETYLWDGKKWYKPKEIRDHWIDPAKYPSNVSRFFGCWERKQYPIFSAKPDVLTFRSDTPVMIATDGIKDVLKLDDINKLANLRNNNDKTKILTRFINEIQRRKTQRDDISILVCGIDKP